MQAETVFNTLNRSNAELLSARGINPHLSIAHWKNKRDRVSYNTDKVHTLSLYIQGGQGCKRVDVNHGVGAAGTLCLIPKSCESRWQIDEDIRFAHLYFTDESIKRFAVKTLDIEPSCIQLPDLSFHVDQALARLCRPLFLGSDHASSMEIEQISNEIFKHLLSHQNYGTFSRGQFRGGLSPYCSRNVREYIEANYSRKISLAELSTVADMSEFHLQRSFKQSHAISPHAYLLEVRLEKAKRRLQQGAELSQLAIACGFNDQSYFNRVFKRNTGMTPRQFRLRFQG